MPAPCFAARWAAAALLLTMTLTLAACGYKGDLTLPPNVAATPSSPTHLPHAQEGVRT